MKHRLLYILGIIILSMVSVTTIHAQLQQKQPIVPASMLMTTTVGPYYAYPSWDQKMPASTRFIVLSDWGNAAVLDKETGLVWERQLSPQFSSWFAAIFRCNKLVLANRMGWRLPTIHELTSLVDPSVLVVPKLPAGHPFTNVQTGSSYWTATTYAALTTNLNAWYLNFKSGNADNNHKSTAYYSWCVRGGQGLNYQ